MPSLPDTAVIILLGLLLFGPKGLAQIARQLGKLMGEFRRASNEFRMQMEEELRVSEQTDRQKQIAAVEAAAPVAPALSSSTADEFGEDHPHIPSGPIAAMDTPSAVEPLPIATSGEMSIMPPSTGLPEPRSSSAVSTLIVSVPKVDAPGSPLNDGSSESEEEKRAIEEQRPMRYTEHVSDLTQDAAAEESLHG